MAPVGPCGQRGPGAVGALRGVPVFVLRLRAGCAFRVVSPVAFAPAVRLGLARSDRVSRGVLPLAAFVPRRPSPARRVRAEADHGFSARAFGGVPASRSRRSASSPRRLRLSPRVFAQASLSSSPSLPRVRVARPQPCRPALAAPPRTAFRSRRRPRARAAPRGRDAEAGCRLCRLRAAFASVGREPASAGCGAASAALFASCLPPPLACVFASVVRLGLGRWGRASRGVLSLAASSSRAAVVRAPRSRRSVASPRQPTLRLAGFPPAADAIPPCPGPRLRRAAARRRPALAGSSPRRLPGGLFAGGGIGRSESGALRGSRRKMATCFEIPRVNPRGGRPPGPCVSFGTKNGAFVTLVRVGDLTKAASASEFRSKWPENGKSSARRGAGGAAPAALAAPRLRAGSPLAPSSSRCPALAPPGRSLAARAFNGAFPLRIAAVRPLAARPPAPRGRGAGSAAALAARAPRLCRGRLSSSPPRAFAKASREEPRPLPRARAFRPQPCRPGPQRCFCAARGRAPPSGASRSMLLPRALSFSRPGGKCPLFWRANTVLQPFPVGFGFLLRRKSHLSQRRPAKTPGSHLAASPCAWKNVAEPCLLATKGASFAPAPSVALTFTSVGSAPSPRLERP